MITLEEFKELGININNELVGNVALEWINDNTTLKVDINDINTVKALPFAAHFFITKFAEVSNLRVGVASESIEGLSQSFQQKDSSALIWDIANQVLYKYLKNQVEFIPMSSGWK